MQRLWFFSSSPWPSPCSGRRP